jgi:hypothetical protein
MHTYTYRITRTTPNPAEIQLNDLTVEVRTNKLEQEARHQLEYQLGKAIAISHYSVTLIDYIGR